MTLILTATAEPTNVPPRVKLEVSSPGAVLSTVALFRDGVPLRFEPILTGDYALAYDYDAPFDVEMTYRADVTETSSTADWTETWASLASWTGSGWAVGSGVASSSTPGASIYRNAAGTIGKVTVTSPANMSLELADTDGYVLARVTVLPIGTVVVSGSTAGGSGVTDTAAQSVAGTGSYTVTFSDASMTVSGTTPAAWSATVPYAGVPIRVRLVAPEVGTLMQQFSIRRTASPTTRSGSKHGVAVDSTGAVYVAISNYDEIWKFDSAGTFLFSFGGSGSGDGQFDQPTRMVVDASDNVFVVDSLNHRVQKFNSSGVYQSKFGTFGSGNGQFSLPWGITIDGSGNMWVVDSNNERVQKFNSSGTYQSQFGSAGSGNGQFGANGPTDIALDGSGNIYVADYINNRIQKFNSSGVYQSQTGSLGAGAGQFTGPAGLVVDSAGNIYVVDVASGGRVQKFDSSYTFLGQFDADNADALFKDSSGNLWLSNSVANTVSRMYTGAGSTDDIAVYLGAGATVDSDTQTVTLSPTGDSAGVWLTNTANPEMAVRLASDADLVMASSTRASRQYATNSVSLPIEGSSDVLVVRTAPRAKAMWNLDVLAFTETACDQLMSVLADDAPLTLRLPATGYEGLTDGYYSVGDVEDSRVGHPSMEHVVVVTLPMRDALPPANKPLNQWNMDALAQTGMTMDEVNAAYASMNDLLVGP